MKEFKAFNQDTHLCNQASHSHPCNQLLKAHPCTTTLVTSCSGEATTLTSIWERNLSATFAVNRSSPEQLLLTATHVSLTCAQDVSRIDLIHPCNLATDSHSQASDSHSQAKDSHNQASDSHNLATVSQNQATDSQDKLHHYTTNRCLNNNISRLPSTNSSRWFISNKRRW